PHARARADLLRGAGDPGGRVGRRRGVTGAGARGPGTEPAYGRRHRPRAGAIGSPLATTAGTPPLRGRARRATVPGGRSDEPARRTHARAAMGGGAAGGATGGRGVRAVRQRITTAVVRRGP